MLKAYIISQQRDADDFTSNLRNGKNQFNSRKDNTLKFLPSLADTSKVVKQYSKTSVGKQFQESLRQDKGVNENDRHKNSFANRNNKIIIGSSSPKKTELLTNQKQHLKECGFV